MRVIPEPQIETFGLSDFVRWLALDGSAEHLTVRGNRDQGDEARDGGPCQSDDFADVGDHLTRLPNTLPLGPALERGIHTRSFSCYPILPGASYR